jgi:hypothetical protein
LAKEIESLNEDIISWKVKHAISVKKIRHESMEKEAVFKAQDVYKKRMVEKIRAKDEIIVSLNGKIAVLESIVLQHQSKIRQLESELGLSESRIAKTTAVLIHETGFRDILQSQLTA